MNYRRFWYSVAIIVILAILGTLIYRDWAEFHENQLDEINQAEAEQIYQTEVNTFINDFQTYQSQYSILLDNTHEGIMQAQTSRKSSGFYSSIGYSPERLAGRMTSTSLVLPESVIDDVTSLSNSVLEFRDFRDRFTLITPPSCFFGFHLMMNNALTEYIESSRNYSAYYSQELKRMTEGAEVYTSVDTASEMLLTAENTFVSAKDMYSDLLKTVR